MGGKPLSEAERALIAGDIRRGLTLRQIIRKRKRGAGTVNRVRMTLPIGQRGRPPNNPGGSVGDRGIGSAFVAEQVRKHPGLARVVQVWQRERHDGSVRFHGELARVSDICRPLGFSTSTFNYIRGRDAAVAAAVESVPSGEVIVVDGKEIQPHAFYVSLEGVIRFFRAHASRSRGPSRIASAVFTTAEIMDLRVERDAAIHAEDADESANAEAPEPPEPPEPVVAPADPAGQHLAHIQRVEGLLHDLVDEATSARAFDLATSALSLLAWYLETNTVKVRRPIHTK